MFNRRWGATVFAALAIQLANAQQHEIGLTLGALTGGDRRGPQGRISPGNGVAFQANYGYHLIEIGKAALFAEVHFLASPLRELASSNSLATRDFASLYVVPGLRVKFLQRSAWSPYVAVGGGYALYEQSLKRIDGSPNPAPRYIHRGVFGFGGGADFKLWRFIGGRLEVRDFYSGNPAFNIPVSGGQHNVVAGGGFTLNFGSSER